MNRRQLLGRIFSAGAASAVVTPAPIRPLGPTDDFLYRGFRCLWTGWKARSEQNCDVGQWLAASEQPWALRYGPDQLRLYVSVPGMIGGGYFQGAVFNLTHRNQWPWIEMNTPDTVRRAVIAEGRLRIIRLIDLAHETSQSGPVDPYALTLT